jgi:RNA polymerase primary sigma factor
LADDDITKPIGSGGEKEHPTYGEMSNVDSSEELEDLVTTIGARGFDLLEITRELSFSAQSQPDEELKVDAFPVDIGALGNGDDPVRFYLREMGVVPLLTRQGEVDIAKRIEHGQRRALRALSHRRPPRCDS